MQPAMTTNSTEKELQQNNVTAPVDPSEQNNKVYQNNLNIGDRDADNIPDRIDNQYDVPSDLYADENNNRYIVVTPDTADEITAQIENAKSIQAVTGETIVQYPVQNHSEVLSIANHSNQLVR